MKRLLARRGPLLLGAAAVLATLAWTAVAGAAPSADWTYVSNPPKAQVELAGSGTAAGGVPYCTSSNPSIGSLVCYAPSFIRSAYDVPSSLDGSGQTILIVDAYGSPTIRSDLHHFDQTFDLPDPNLTIACPEGCPRPSSYNFMLDPAGWAIETTLDVEWAHVIAPKASIVLVVAPSPSGNAINNAERKVIPQYPGAVMSQSFGIPEYAIKAGSNNAQLKQARANYVAARDAGITVLASAGDAGATNGISSPNALYPSSDPLVTAVGGTQGVPYVSLGTTPTGSSGLVTFSGTCTAGTRPAWPSDCSPTGYGGESAWNESAFGAATGGAPSLLFPAPSYQQGVDTGSTQRTTSDVSFDAAINGGVLVYISASGQGIWYVVGGTSAGSPQWAGIVALANQARADANEGPLGFANPALYAIGESSSYASAFHDVASGDNQLAGTPAGYPAGSGYDLPTGWGTPDVANLVGDLTSQP